MNYGFVIDTRSCIGCHACSTACKSENQVPLGVNRTWVKVTEKGRFPDVTRHFQVTRCNHCANPPCVRSCPTTAMYQRDDGIVEFDPDVCIGCKACTQACPYDAIHMDPDTHTASKCHFCAHRVDMNLEPACVVVCPEHAIIAGDMDDPTSEISRVLAKESVTVRKPEQGTSPKLFYIEGNELALHPNAFDEPPESYMFADVVRDHGHSPSPSAAPSGTGRSFSGTAIRTPQPQGLASGGPIQIGGRMAEHMVQVGYNAQHRIQWHWPIPAYLVTKGTAAGIFLVLGLAVLLGVPLAPHAFTLGGGVALLLMLVTFGLLIYDLDRPERFLFLLIRPQWRSWVARAAWILSGFFVLAGLWWGLELGTGGASDLVRRVLAVATLPFALMTGIYTAFLFAQAEGRDLWQSQATPIHMALQVAYLGAGAALVLDLAPWADGALRVAFMLALAASAFTILFAELGTARASEAAARAVHRIKHGKYRRSFWWGAIGLGHLLPVALVTAGVPALSVLAFLAAAVGTYLYAYAFVMAPQEIPNS